MLHNTYNLTLGSRIEKDTPKVFFKKAYFQNKFIYIYDINIITS